MSFDRPYPNRKDRRRPYRGKRKSAAVDTQCRNHGACPWCRGNRTIQDTRARESAEEQLDDPQA